MIQTQIKIMMIQIQIITILIQIIIIQIFPLGGGHSQYAHKSYFTNIFNNTKYVLQTFKENTVNMHTSHILQKIINISNTTKWIF